ncbi:MAG: hypothetical protein ACI9DC_001770 [Gammaproteobacteria bacterium]|jgi:hypothetical protein
MAHPSIARMTRLARCSCRFLLFIVAMTAPIAAYAEAVAMIADLKGVGCTLSGKKPLACEILAYLEPGSTLELKKGVRAAVVYFKSGREFMLVGPGQTRIDAASPETLSGEVPRSQSLSLARDMGLRARDVQSHRQAAFVLRGAGTARRKLRIRGPRNTRIINPRPTFEWETLESGAQYRFVLSDEDGRILLQTLVSGTRFALPSEVKLSANTVYTWQIDTRLADGATFSSTADFSLLAKSKRRMLQKMKPATDARVSELVLYAVLLEREGVRDDAKKWWALAAEQRPQEGVLKRMAGR